MGLGENVCLFKQDKPQQCIDSRDQSSNICGACKLNWSVALGSEKCVPCEGNAKYNAFWIIPCLLLMFLIIDFVLIYFDIDIYSNYLNGFIYFCQTVVLLPPSSFQLWKLMKIIIGLLNMESTGGDLQPFCFIPGLDNLDKQIVNYLFPTFMLISLWLISFTAHIHPIAARFFARTNKTRAFTIISVLAYADYTRITFLLMNKSQIDPDDPQQYVWIQGDVKYLSSGHIGYFVVALIFLVFIVVGFPLVLVLSSQ